MVPEAPFDWEKESRLVEDEEPFDWEAESRLVEDTGPTEAEAIARGAGQGATLGWMDELTGLTQAAADMGPLGAVISPLSKPLMYAAQLAAGRPLGEEIGGAGEEAARRGLTPMRQYREARDVERAATARAQEAQPVAFGAGQFAGGLPAAVAAPGMRAAAGMGAVAGLGGAEGDVTRGEVAPALVQTAVGGALGAAGQKVGQQLARPLTWLAERAGRGVAAAGASLDELTAKSLAKKVAIAAGELGGETQKGNRFLEVLMWQLDQGTPVQKAAVQALDEAGIMGELRQRLLDSVIESLPAQAGVIAGKRAALEELQQNAPRYFAEERARLASPWAQIKPRLQRYAAPVVGSLVGGGAGAALGGGVGALLGGGEGGRAGAVMGGLAGAGARPAARAIARMAQHPAIAGPAWGAVEWLARRAAQTVPAIPRALGLMGAGVQEQVANVFRAHAQLAQRHGAAYQQALERGPEALAAWHEVTKQRDPEYRAAMEES